MLLALNPISARKTRIDTASAKATNQQFQRQLPEMVATMEPPKKAPVAKKELQENGLLVIGLNHNSAPVAVREKLAAPKEEWNVLAAQLRSFDSVDEAAVLSTCNRFELYLVANDSVKAEKEIMNFLAERSGIGEEELRGYLFFHRETDMVMHVLRVASGLDSLVMGEGQILSQMKACYQQSMASKTAQAPAGSAGKKLARILNQAVSTGKHVRFAFKLSEGGVSISSAGVQLAELKAKTEWNRILDDCYTAVVGAGEMSRLLLIHLGSLHLREVTLFNRSPESAQKLADSIKEGAPDMQVNIHLMDEFDSMLGDYDIIFTATSSTDPIVTKEQLIAQEIGVEEPLMLVDISMPSNVEAGCGDLEGIQSYNVDNLKEVVDANTAARRERAEQAQGYIKEELVRIDNWMQSLPYQPVIRKLENKYESKIEELLESSEALQSLTDEQRDAIMGAAASWIDDTVANIRRPDVQDDVSPEQMERLLGLDR